MELEKNAIPKNGGFVLCLQSYECRATEGRVTAVKLNGIDTVGEVHGDIDSCGSLRYGYLCEALSP